MCAPWFQVFQFFQSRVSEFRIDSLPNFQPTFAVTAYTAYWVDRMSYAAPLVKDSELIKLLRDKTKVPKKDYVVIDVRDHDFTV
jgi:hypothetical protein